MKRTPSSKLLVSLRAELARQADPANASQMQAYMKSAMPYHGVKLPLVRKLASAAFKDVSFADSALWQKEVRAIWHGAQFREERYLALNLLQHRSAKAFRTIDALPLYEELIVTGAWWDTVDDVAVHVLGPLLDADDKRAAAAAARAMRAWSKSVDLWKQRSSIICQVLRKDRTDLLLLSDCIEPSLARKEFFLRKAIGWSLRAYAWVDPTWVKGYVKAHGPKLSPLSVREALKNVTPKKK